MNSKKVLNGSQSRKGIQHRIAPDNPNGVGQRTSLSRIPRRIEALYIAFVKDAHKSDLILTREELDENPATKLLPNSEKDLLVKYWPAFQGKANLAMALADGRQKAVKTLSADHKNAALIKRKNGIRDTLSEPDQLRATAHVCTKIFKDTVIVLAASPALTEDTDELEIALWKNREQRARSMAHFAKVSIDLALRLEEITTDEMQSAGLTDEAQQALNEADLELHKLGFGHLSASDVVNDGDE